jgi:hypothetical protein
VTAPETAATTTERRVRHIQLLGHRLQPQPIHHLERQPTPDHLHRIQPLDKHQVRQQRVRAPTRRTPTPANPDPLDQQRRA